jgi:hypothetical protein
MTDPSVEIHVTTKLVDEGYYEFSYVYGEGADRDRPSIGIPGKVVPTGSSMIAPGLVLPVAPGPRT